MLEDSLLGSPSTDEPLAYGHVLNSRIASSPTSQVSDNSDLESVYSTVSAASSQTSYSSSQTGQWLGSIQEDPQERAGKQPVTVLNHEIRSVNPRRTSCRDQSPPSLVRQHERKGQFVYHLVDSASQLVEVIWPTAAPACLDSAPQYHQSVLPLRIFIEETLRRSKTSFSTLQVALYYLILLKPFVPSFDFTMEQPRDSAVARALQCGRRMFLAALILASKYLQDKNYSARAWSKISGLQVSEINLNERAFLAAVGWELHIPEKKFNKWQDILVKYSHPERALHWRGAVRLLQPDLSIPSPSSRPVPAQVFGEVDWKNSISENNWSPVSAASSPRGFESYKRPPVAPRPGQLPTPSPITSSVFATPAASCATEMLKPSRSRAMCSAMSMANAAVSRHCSNDLPPSALGLNGAPGHYARPSCGSSLVNMSNPPSVASSPRSSSPGSLVSDHGSRSSSISTTYSLSQAQIQIHNAHRRQAMRQRALNTAQKDATTINWLDNSNVSASPDVIDAIEDEGNFSSNNVYHAEIYEPSRESRKRHRNSLDTSYMNVKVDSSKPAYECDATKIHVRNLLCRSQTVAHAFTKPANKKPCLVSSMSEIRERPGFVRPEGGPGMWSNIL